ncbi:unnamed protein product [Strongylus vulgaris]|uniref:Uncharacterized protein n=1 Tax=Strongylus vulgaris TaxID=40348 RepID=A0A3P7JMJ9_STRVU|nr:unnamed protein product [Strongylus vulgaris]
MARNTGFAEGKPLKKSDHIEKKKQDHPKGTKHDK